MAAIAAVVLGAGGVAFAGNALATPSGSRAMTATVHDDDCDDQEPGYDTVRPSWGDDCDEGGDHTPVCPTVTTTTTEPGDGEVVLQHKKKPRPHPTQTCPTDTPTSPTETVTEPPTETTPPTPTETVTTPPTETETPTPTPTPCDTESGDDDCGVVTEPPGFAG